MKFVKNYFLYILAGFFLVFVVSQYIASSGKNWTIQPTAIGNLTLDSPLPISFLSLRPIFYDDMHVEGKIENGIYLQRKDVRVALRYYFFVDKIYPGPKFKTEKGLGVGSTLKDLRLAYGRLSIYNVPGSNMCAVNTHELYNVFFEFQDCSSANKGDGVIRIVLKNRSEHRKQTNLDAELSLEDQRVY